MSRAYSEHEPDVRSKRLSRPPCHLKDYEVEYRGFQHTYPPPLRALPEPRHSESEIQSTSYQMEGAAKMTPLTRWHETDSGDVAEDIGEPYIDKDAQMMIRKLREQNGRLHKTIGDLKRRSERDETDSSQCPSPLPHSHSLRSIEKKQTRVPPVPACIPPKPYMRNLSPSPYSHIRERTDDYPRPHYQSEDLVPHPPPPPTRESTYRGPIPLIPDFTAEDPRQFARLRISLDNLLPLDATEQFKYQILLEHLKCEEALLIADSYSNSRYPYTQTMQSLTEHYGQPHQLALQKIADLMDGPIIRSGDTQAFRRFALRVRALVGMLDQLDEKGAIELQCGSHVARLMSKLPHDLKANFKRYVHPLKNPIPNLLDFAHWLEFELQVQSTDSKLNTIETRAVVA